MKDIVDVLNNGNKYKMPHKFSFITLEEFCELNNIQESELTDDQIKFFYDNYGCSKGLPASIYDASHTHNDWVVENFKSHDYKDASDFVKQSKYVYHITYKDNLQNILKKGLRPKAKKTQEDSIYRYYTDRVFLIVDSPNIKKDLVNVIQDLGYNPFSDDYVILKIDISKLNITYWWDDASGGETVYTIESIPPKFIKVIGNVMNFDS